MIREHHAMTARLVAVLALWLACFAGTFQATCTVPTVACDGSPEAGPLSPVITLRRCDGRDTTFTLPARMPGQDCPFDVTAQDGHVYWIEGRFRDPAGNLSCGYQSLMFSLPALPDPPPPPPDTTSGGLAARFYIGQSRGGAVVYADTTNVDGTWGLGSPGPGMPVDDWSAEWIGHVTIPTAGLWTWYLKSEDGAQLFLDGTLGINHLVVQPLTEWTWTVNMAAREYAIQVIYRANVGNSECHLSLSGPGFTKQVVPRGMLR